MMTSTRQRCATAAVLVACAAGLLTGCGDDKKADTGSDTTTTLADAGTGEKAAGASEAACSAYTDVSAAFGSEDAPDPAKVKPLLDTLDKEAPAELKDDLSVMTSGARKALDSQDMSAFDSPEFSAAQSKADSYFFDNCTYDKKLEVTAKEYEYEGIPDTLDAGTVAMKVTNEGAEPHEISIARKKDGVTESFDELLALPEDQATQKIDMVGGAFVPQKGSSSMAVVDLTPGEYIAVCFVPTGSKIDASGEHEGSGPPHFMQGMKKEFTVS
jgi:hypothetical protein